MSPRVAECADVAKCERMLPCRSASDESRRKNQFSKDERLHLLNIMGQYAPLLDDKSASLFGRREIWRAIERDFHQAGFTGKTSAQLKKYWQNYKYHGKRAQTVNRRRDADPVLLLSSSCVVRGVSVKLASMVT